MGPDLQDCAGSLDITRSVSKPRVKEAGVVNPELTY